MGRGVHLAPCECGKGAEGSSSSFPKSMLQQSGAVAISEHGNLQCATTAFQETGVFKTRQYQYTRLATSVPHLSDTIVQDPICDQMDMGTL